MTMEISLDLFGIALSAFICFSLAAFWFSPALFGTVWQKKIGADEATMKQLISPQTFSFSFVLLLLFSAAVNIIITKFDAVGLMEGVASGILIWLVVTFAHGAAYVAFERRSFILFAIYSGYYLVASVISSTIFALWR